MKKYTVVVFFLSFSFLHPFLSLSQEKREAANNAKNKVINAADLKSGTSQDVLISFFQVAAENLTGNNKSFKFQSSLFAIKAKTNDDLWIDNYYLKERFARNFNITINPALDSNYRFKSNTIGLKYAIVNHRDKTVFDFSKPADMEYLQIQREAIEEYKKLVRDINDPRYEAVVGFFAAVGDGKDEKGLTAEKDLPDEFKKILQNKISKQKEYSNLSLEAFRDYLDNQYKSLAKYVENRGLWTAEANFSSLADGRLFSGINIVSEYLKGMLKENTKMNLELNLKGTMDFSDDTSSKLSLDLNRQLLKLAGGFNWIIVKNKNYKPLIELKGTFVYNTILNGVHTAEKKNNLTAEGTLRFRITNDTWLPLTFKYDPKTRKVFTSLNAKFNFSWLKGRTSS